MDVTRSRKEENIEHYFGLLCNIFHSFYSFYCHVINLAFQRAEVCTLTIHFDLPIFSFFGGGIFIHLGWVGDRDLTGDIRDLMGGDGCFREQLELGKAGP